MKKFAQCLTLVLAAVFLLASCGDTPSQGEETLSQDTSPAVTDAPETTTAETDYYMNVPEGTTFGGKTFTFLGYNYNGNWKVYMDPESETGDIVNDSAYRRNGEVEEKLQIDFREIQIDGMAEHEKAFKTSVLAGDGAYDLMCFWASGERSSFITEGIAGDWQALGNMDLTSPWYNQTANTAYSIGGKQYFAVSDFTFPVQQHWRLLFNKKLMSDYKLEYPYQDVYAGTWTYDKLRSLITNTYKDVNADGKAGLEDSYGLSANNVTLGVMAFNSGEMPIHITKNGFELNLYSDRILNIVEDMVALTKNPNVYDVNVGGANFRNLFSEGRAMFITYSSDPELLRDIEFDYGYLPYPKYDAAQENYIVWSCGGMMAYPSNAKDTVFTGTVMEALSAGSAKYVKDAFVEKYIEGKVLRDTDSVTIYRMMRDLATYDFSYNFDPSGKLTGFAHYSQFNKSQSADLASWWGKNQVAIQSAFDDLFAKCMKK